MRDRVFKSRNFKFRLAAFALSALAFASFAASRVSAQTQTQAPLTSDELVRLVRRLPKNPLARDEIISEIRKRGIGFTLTSGLRSIVATKSGNDALLRRTLEEAERRHLNPVASALPSEGEAQVVLARTREATLAVAEKMPDFVVKQLVTRSYARGTTKNWINSDRLVVAVSFRASAGEQYKVLAVNGLPNPVEAQEGSNYAKLGGTSSTGEYVTLLASLFTDESKTEFKAADTDTLRGRRTIIYEYELLRPNSKRTITYNGGEPVIVGERGRVWVDRETFRVLRIEAIATDIPTDYPVTAAGKTIDYEWVNIAEKPYLLPSRAQVELSVLQNTQPFQTRNDIRFRNYQKYGTEIRIIEEDVVEDETLEKKP